MKSQLNILYDNLLNGFNISELQEICLRLDVPYEQLSGSTLNSKSQELIQYLNRRSRIDELIRLGSELRPNLLWEEVAKVNAQDISNQALKEQQERVFIHEFDSWSRKDQINGMRKSLEITFKTETELRRFCHDFYAYVDQRLKETDRYDYIVTNIIDYCQSRGVTHLFWSHINEHNPKVFEVVSNRMAK